jgi:hypothetical protein
MLKKLLMMSVILATFIIPMRAARSSSPVRGLRRAAVQMLGWIAFYIGLVSFLQF